MQDHQKLTIVGIVLLVATYVISNYHEMNHSGIGFNYAYITGISMLIVFIASFVLFGKDRIKESKSKK
jgi:Mg2+ and Co2+ transporter CorA